MQHIMQLLTVFKRSIEDSLILEKDIRLENE